MPIKVPIGMLVKLKQPRIITNIRAQFLRFIRKYPPMIPGNEKEARNIIKIKSGPVNIGISPGLSRNTIPAGIVKIKIIGTVIRKITEL